MQPATERASAPGRDCPHDAVAQHLSNVPCTDEYSREAVETYATIARTRHCVVARLCSRLKMPLPDLVSLGEVVRCLTLCKDNYVAPPPFLVDFQDGVVQTWASEIITHLRKGGGWKWSLAERSALVCTLNSALHTGLCHRQHVSVVDQGRNPSWLAEYVRCIRMIWKDNGGVSTPETMQYLRKLGCCTCECVTLISEYASLRLNATKTMQVYRDLCRMQRLICSSYTGVGMSNAAATECIQQLTFAPSVLVWLEEVEETLNDIWDTITNPHADETRCVTLPGIKGSHVQQFMIPSKVALCGTPSLIRNCIQSSLPLCQLNPAMDHDILMSSSHPGLKNLCDGMVACVRLMLCAVRAHGACDAAWLERYMALTRAVLKKVCQDTGVGGFSLFPETTHIAQGATAACCGIPMSILIKRATYKESAVRKVQIAGNLFDCTVLNIKHWKATKTSRTRDFSTVWDDSIQGYKNDTSGGGKVISDLKRIVNDHDMCMDIRVDIAAKTVAYNSELSAIKFLSLLLEYMREFSKSRRKRKDSLMLKKNAVPQNDKRRGANKRQRVDAASG